MPSIAKVNKQFGYDFTQAYIEAWIVNLRGYFNIGRNMTDEQTQETACLIIDQFFNITIADINLIFKKAKLGNYGKIYDRLDGQIILSWFDNYFQNRCNMFAERSIQEADKYKSDKFDRTSEPTKVGNIKRK